MGLTFMLLSSLSINAQEREPNPPPPAPEVAETEIFKVVEQMPRFPGCEMLRASEEVIKKCANEKMFEYIGKNLVYPKTAKEAKVEGTAVVNFVVSKKGQLDDIKILRDVNGHFADVVTQLIEGMPTWIPGKQRGKAVAVMYTLPVKFKLDKDLPVNGKSKKGDTGAMDKNGKGDKMSKGKKMGTVSPFGKSDKSKKVLKDDPNAPTDIPPPPPPPPAPSEEENETFKIVEQMPRFPGCEKMNITEEEKKKCSDEKMLQYIYKNIKYPSIARENGVEGMAIIRFVVEKDGSINEARIERDPGSGIGQESLRVIESMNNMSEKWTPGTQKGKPVRVMYTMPVKFKLEGSSKSSKRKWWQFWK